MSVTPRQMIFEGIELGAPELAVGREPGIELGQRRCMEAVEAAWAVDADTNQPGFAQGLEMFGDVRLRQVEGFNQGAGGLLPLPEQSEDVAANGIGDGGECGHANRIPTTAYSCQGILLDSIAQGNGTPRRLRNNEAI